MTRGSRQASIIASPVLIGALTLLVVIVAVFLAYNANQGLPFVPTFDARAELEGGQNLVASNDVRVGGFRVGAVDRITPKVDPETGKTIAVVHMKLDKKVEPIPIDTRVAVRPRSNLGLKYIEMTLGRSKTALKPGDTLPLAQSTTPVELDEYFSTFNEEMRENTQTALDFVPEQHTDFIFTAVGEQLGFVGAATLLGLFALLIWRALRIAGMARDLFGTLIASGIAALWAFQLFVNVGMTMGIMPITGIPLPFISYGGSSLITNFVAVGLLLNIHMRRFL